MDGIFIRTLESGQRGESASVGLHCTLMGIDMKEKQEILRKKKQYSPPVLTEYGEVAKLTEAHGISVTDDAGSNNMYRPVI